MALYRERQQILTWYVVVYVTLKCNYIAVACGCDYTMRCSVLSWFRIYKF